MLLLAFYSVTTVPFGWCPPSIYLILKREYTIGIEFFNVGKGPKDLRFWDETQPRPDHGVVDKTKLTPMLVVIAQLLVNGADSQRTPRMSFRDPWAPPNRVSSHFTRFSHTSDQGLPPSRFSNVWGDNYVFTPDSRTPNTCVRATPKATTSTVVGVPVDNYTTVYIGK